MDDNIEFNNKYLYVIGIIIILVILVIGGLHFYTFQTDKIVERIEKYIYLENLPYWLDTRINENMTIKQIQGVYEMTKPYSTLFLREEVKLICGK